MVKKDKSDFIFIQENFCDDIIKAIEKETRIVYSIKVIDGVVVIGNTEGLVISTKQNRKIGQMIQEVSTCFMETIANICNFKLSYEKEGLNFVLSNNGNDNKYRFIVSTYGETESFIGENGATTYCFSLEVNDETKDEMGKYINTVSNILRTFMAMVAPEIEEELGLSNEQCNKIDNIVIDFIKRNYNKYCKLN